MINLKRIVVSKNFAQPNGYTVYRKTGTWVKGRIVETESTLHFHGTILPATEKEMEQIPEADRIKGTMVFYSPQEIYTTRVTTDGQATSDQISWNGKRWKVVAVRQWKDFGYYKAYGVYMEGK